MTRPPFPQHSKPLVPRSLARDEEMQLSQMNGCYRILKAFFVTSCVVLYQLRSQADNKGQNNVPLLQCLARPETRKTFVVILLCFEHCLTLFVQTGANFRDPSLRYAIQKYLQDRFDFGGYGWATFLSRSCPPLVKTGKELAKQFARYQAVRGQIIIMNQLYMKDFVFENVDMTAVYTYAGTSLNIERILHGLDGPKIELITAFSKVFLNNLEHDLEITSMTHVLLRLTPKWPGPAGPTVVTGFLIANFTEEIDFSTLYYVPPEPEPEISEIDEQGNAIPKVGNSLTTEKIMEDPVWNFIQTVEKEFSDGQYVPGSLAEWLGYRANTSTDEILAVFHKYCSNRTPTPELLALFLTHALLFANEGRKKRVECNWEGDSKGKMGCDQNSFQPPTPMETDSTNCEVSIPSGEDLIIDSFRLVTYQYYLDYQQKYKGKISWDTFCQGGPQNLKFLIPKDPWFNDINPPIVKETTPEDPPRRVMIRPEEDDQDVPDRGGVPRVEPAKPLLPVKKLPAGGGLSITNPLFAMQRTVPTSGSSSRATTSTTAVVRPAKHRGPKDKRTLTPKGTHSGGVSGRRRGRAGPRGTAPGVRTGKIPRPEKINGPVCDGTPSNPPEPRTGPSEPYEDPSEVLDNFVDHTADNIQGYLYAL